MKKVLYVTVIYTTHDTMFIIKTHDVLLNILSAILKDIFYFMDVIP